LDRIVIAGGGISGLSLAFTLLESEPAADVVVFESEKRPGGKIWTEKVNGFLCEGGVNGFLDNRPKTLELATKLLINPFRSSDAARKRYVFSGGKLNLLPESPVSFLTSDLLSLYGRLRVMYAAQMMKPLLILRGEGSAKRHTKNSLILWHQAFMRGILNH